MTEKRFIVLRVWCVNQDVPGTRHPQRPEVYKEASVLVVKLNDAVLLARGLCL